MTFRKNYSSSLRLKKLERDGAGLYKDWHWGIGPTKKVNWSDPDYPSGIIIECGRMFQLRFREPGKRKNTIIQLTPSETANSHIGFDPNHQSERIYLFSDPAFARRMSAKFNTNPRYGKVNLNEAAHMIGGLHDDGTYPDLMVRPVGILTHLVYATEKQGDGPSNYIHELGEESKLRPALCIDAKGRFWIAGGNYTAPTPGITD